MRIKNTDLIKKLINELKPDIAYSINNLFELYINLYAKVTFCNNHHLDQWLDTFEDENDEGYSLASFSRAISRQCKDTQRLKHYCHKYIKPSKHLFYQDKVSLKWGIRLDNGVESPCSSDGVIQINHDVHWLLSVINRYLLNSKNNDIIGFFTGETALILLNNEIDVRNILNWETLELITNKQTAKRVRNVNLSFTTNGNNSNLCLKLHSPRQDSETQTVIKISKNNYLPLQVLELISHLKTRDLQEYKTIEKINIYIYKNNIEFLDYLTLF